jgi:sugar lactone lactonase YvrE
MDSLDSFVQPIFLIMSSPAEQKVSYTLLTDPEEPSNVILPLVDSGLGQPRGVVYDPVNSVLYVADLREETIICYHIQVQRCASSSCRLPYELIVDSVQMHVAYSVKCSWLAVDETGSLYYSDEGRRSINRIDVLLLRRIHGGLITSEHIRYTTEKELNEAVGQPKAASRGPLATKRVTTEEKRLMETSIISLYQATDDGQSMVGTPAGVASDGLEVYWTHKENGLSTGSVAGGLIDLTAMPESLVIANKTDSAYGLALTSTEVLFTDKEHFLYSVPKSGGTVTTLSDTLHSPRGLAWDGYFTGFVADQGSDAIFSFPTGQAAPSQPLRLVASFHGPFGIAIVKATDPAFAPLQVVESWACGNGRARFVGFFTLLALLPMS